jgi:hypothetical protein
MLSSIFHAFSVHVIFWECTLFDTGVGCGIIRLGF